MTAVTPLKGIHRIAIVGIACTLAVMLTACAGEDAGNDSTSITPPTSETTAADDAEETTNSEPSDPTTCLHGNWIANNDYFLASIREFGDEVKDVSGSVALSFGEDGSLTTVYKGWLITASADGNTMKIHRDGTDTGTFSATATTVSLTEAQIGSKMTLSAAGVDMNIDLTPISYTDADYRCEPMTASITTPDGTLKLTRP